MFSRGTVEDAVASRWHSSNKDGNCSISEASDKLRKALAQTKGACNCELAIDIAIRKNSTVEDIARVGSWIGEDGKAHAPGRFDRVIRHRHEKLSGYGRRQIQQDKRLTKLEDSVYGKYLKSKGLWGTVKELNLDKHNSTHILTEGCYWHERRELNMLMFVAKLSMERIAQFMPNVNSQWMKRLNVGGDNDDRKEAKQNILKEEFEALNQAPEEVLQDIEKHYIEGSNRTPHTFGGAFWATWSSGGQVAYYNELGRMAMEALKYMGIGIYHDTAGYYTQLPSKVKKGAIPLAKKMVSIQKTFNSMLKQGFEPSLVREEMCSQLTEFAKERCEIGWRFFSRLDAPMTYEVAEKKKPNAKKSNSGAKSQEPRIENIGGMELRF